jgi:hypothetical protein
MRTAVLLIVLALAATAQPTPTENLKAAVERNTAVSKAAAGLLNPPRGKFAAVSVLDGPDACSPVAIPQSSELQVGGQLCFQPPSPSGLTPFADFNFGGVSQPLTPPDKTFVHGYSLPSPISAQNRYVGVTDPAGNHYALDRITSAMVRIPGPTAAPMWDAANDDWFYFLSGSQVMRHSMTGGVDTVASDFTGKLTSLSQGGSTHLSSDNWLALWSEPEHTVCAVNLANGTQYCADYLAAETRAAVVPFTFVDFSMVTDIDTGTNKRYVMLVAYPSLGVWSVDMAGGKLHFESRGPEFLGSQGFNSWGAGNSDSICDPGENCLGAPHGDAANIAGRQYFVTYADTAGAGGGSCERDLVAYPIAAGIDMITKRVLIVPMAYCSSAYDWPDFWVGCSPRGAGCVVSTASSGVAPYGNQLMFLRDLDHVIKLGFHRSQARGSDSYWWYPRAGISPDGRYIVYDSNLGRADEGNSMSHEQVFLMRTGR